MSTSKEQMAARLKQARILAGFKSVTSAAESLGVPYPTYAAHENASRGVETDAARHYARRYNVSLDWLLTGKTAGAPTEVKGVRPVTVAAHIQAGVWTESWEWSPDEQYTVYVPDDAEYHGYTLYAAETKGPSMNKRYPERTVLVFTNVTETSESPVPGKRYIVERRRADGEAEHTVKLLHKDGEGKFWLLPESDDPRYQAPISIEDGTGDNDIVSILGRVCYAVSRE